ncbi:MAG: hypothetical protein LBQ43_00795, partial [Holosporales bacterium]|nr:hypothetical protein [Holosporales bacterium]
AYVSARVADLSRFATLNGFTLEFETLQSIAGNKVLSQSVLHNFFDSKNDDAKVEGLNDLLFLTNYDDVAKEILLYADKCGLDLSQDVRFTKNAENFRLSAWSTCGYVAVDRFHFIVRLLHYSLDHGGPVDLKMKASSLISSVESSDDDSEVEVLLKYALFKRMLANEDWNQLLVKSINKKGRRFELIYKYALKSGAKIPNPDCLIAQLLDKSCYYAVSIVRQVARDSGSPIDMLPYLETAIDNDSGSVSYLLECVDASEVEGVVLPRLRELTTESAQHANWLSPVLKYCLDNNIKLPQSDLIVDF